jgi:hypothetical protein
LFSAWDPAKERWNHHALPNVLGLPALVAHVPSRAWMMTVENEGDGFFYSILKYSNGKLVSEKTPLFTIDNGEPPTFDVQADGTIWAIANGTLWRRHNGGKWSKIQLPQPVWGRAEKPVAVRANSVTVQLPDDVWISATYTDRRREAKNITTRTLLLRNRPAKEVQYYGGEGFVSMPPPATPDCATPLAVLARLSNTDTTEKLSKKLTAALNAAKLSTALALLEQGLSRYIVSQPADFATGKKLVEAVAKRVAQSTPELVCYSPERTLAVIAMTTATPEGK